MIPRFKPWLGWPELVALFKPNKGAVERFEKAFAKKFEAVDAVAFPYDHRDPHIWLSAGP
jgi:hypothetical protein